MKFDNKEIETINNFFKWINELLNDEKKYKIGDSFIEDKKTGKIIKIDVAYGIEMLEFIENTYYIEYYEKNLIKGQQK